MQLHRVQVLLEHSHVFHEVLDLVVALVGEVGQEFVKLCDVNFNLLQSVPEDGAQIRVDLANWHFFGLIRSVGLVPGVLMSGELV